MPEFKLPGVSIPGLRDMTSDDIRHAIAEVPRPDVKLPDVKLPDIELPRIDLAGAASSLAATASEHNPMRPRRRSRRPLLIAGLVVAGLALAALANASWIRARISDAMGWARTRMDADRVNESLEPLADEDSFGSVGIPIQTDAYTDTLPSAEGMPAGSIADDLPAGVGSRMGSTYDNGFEPERTNEADTRPYGG